jgi:F-type H+-transporting ATPase subunit b
MEEILKDVSKFVEECLGPLGNSGNIWTWLRDFTIQILATLLLFIIVKIFLWGPITKFLEARRDKMDQELLDAEASRERAIQLEEELKTKYDGAKLEIQKLLKEAEAQGNLQRDEIIKEAKLEAQRILTLANEDIKREIAMEENNIKKEIISHSGLFGKKMEGERKAAIAAFLRTSGDIGLTADGAPVFYFVSETENVAEYFMSLFYETFATELYISYATMDKMSGRDKLVLQCPTEHALAVAQALGVLKRSGGIKEEISASLFSCSTEYSVLILSIYLSTSSLLNPPKVWLLKIACSAIGKTSPFNIY